jgi:hypothetical protein
MGSSKDVMELFAERDIRQMFSEHEGWNVVPLPGTQPAGRFFQITRGKWNGVEVAYVAISFDRVPDEEFINALNVMSNGQGSKTKKYLLTPQAADTSVVPHNIRILLMNAFAFSEGQLVWLTKKKNAKRFVQEQAVAARTN